jgi:hypothetical protein
VARVISMSHQPPAGSLILVFCIKFSIKESNDLKNPLVKISVIGAGEVVQWRVLA